MGKYVDELKKSNSTLSQQRDNYKKENDRLMEENIRLKEMILELEPKAKAFDKYRKSPQYELGKYFAGFSAFTDNIID